MPGPNVLEVIAAARKALLARDTKRATELINAYGRIWTRLQRDLEQLAMAAEAGKSRAYMEQRIRELQTQIAEEVTRYAAYADGQLEAGVREAVEAAARDAPQVVAAAYGPLGEALIQMAWNRLDPERIEIALGMLGAGSPLRGRMTDLLGDAVAKQVADALFEGVALGRNPRAIHAELRRQLGKGLEWSLAQTRTATVYAYREATRANYTANSEIVKGYRRMSALIPGRTCMACVALHGTEYPLETPLNDHYNGLCWLEPVVAPFSELGLDLPGPERKVQTGEEWFRSLKPETQRAMMGDTVWEDWKAGRIRLRDMATTRHDDVYGEMTQEAPLRSLRKAA